MRLSSGTKGIGPQVRNYTRKTCFYIVDTNSNISATSFFQYSLSATGERIHIFFGISSVFAAFMAVKLEKKKRRAYLFWGIMAAAFVFLLIKDAGDP